jgi:uncharacterized protein DUF6174
MNPVPACVATLSLLMLSLAGCAESTAPTLDSVLTQRTRWSNQALVDYSYVYQETGYFICCLEGKDITLTVHNDSVVAAMIAASGQPVSPAGFPTINGLFDRAAEAAQHHALVHIAFDPQRAYPVQIDFSGPPDASGSVFASRLQPTP